MSQAAVTIAARSCIDRNVQKMGGSAIDLLGRRQGVVFFVLGLSTIKHAS